MPDDSLTYPLAWPSGWPRTRNRSGSRFGKRTEHQAASEVYHQLELMGVKERDVVISSNVGGLGGRRPKDPGVAVYFHFGGEDRVLACDRWEKLEDNVWAIAKHIEALRGIERWGVGSLERVFTGYVALPSGERWFEVLGCPQTATPKEIEAAFRAKAKGAHPDAGGTHEDMVRLNMARSEGLEESA